MKSILRGRELLMRRVLLLLPNLPFTGARERKDNGDDSREQSRPVRLAKELTTPRSGKPCPSCPVNAGPETASCHFPYLVDIPFGLPCSFMRAFQFFRNHRWLAQAEPHQALTRKTAHHLEILTLEQEPREALGECNFIACNYGFITPTAWIFFKVCVRIKSMWMLSCQRGG